MNNLQSRLDIHVELEDLNAEAVKLAAIIKKNFEVVGV
jgi:type I restriction enzyme M protein